MGHRWPFTLAFDMPLEITCRCLTASRRNASAVGLNAAACCGPVSVCPFVCSSVRYKLEYCQNDKNIESRKQRHNSLENLVFWNQRS